MYEIKTKSERSLDFRTLDSLVINFSELFTLNKPTKIIS